MRSRLMKQNLSISSFGTKSDTFPQIYKGFVAQIHSIYPNHKYHLEVDNILKNILFNAWFSNPQKERFNVLKHSLI